MTDTTDAKPKRASSIADKIVAKEAAIAAAKKRLDQLMVQKQAAEARKNNALSPSDRKVQNRKKVLLGSMLLHELGTDQKLRARLDKWLTRPDDRALFDLTPPPPAGE